MKNALYLEWDRGRFLFFFRVLFNGGRRMLTVVF